MQISVVVCTYNRGETLARALESIASSVMPESVEWEILVVDNNSTDRTRDVFERFSERYPGRFRYLFETRQGLSYARNTGVDASRADLIVFTDDDVIVQPAWLQDLTAHLQDGAWAGAGGRIVPDRSIPRLRWLSVEGKDALAPLTVFDRPLNGGELTEAPFGANMAFRREVFERHGGFRVDLGRCGGGMLSNEDSEFGRRLLAAGERLRYEGSAVVYHPIPESRLRKQYFLAWWFGKGRADIRELNALPDSRWNLAGIPLVLIRRLAANTVRWTLTAQPAKRFTNKLNVWACAGALLEYYEKAASLRKVDRA